MDPPAFPAAVCRAKIRERAEALAKVRWLADVAAAYETKAQVCSILLRLLLQ